MTQAQADACKARGQVFYNGGCQRRGNSCNAGKGYLGQVAGNIGWGVCINFGTRAPKDTPTKQTNNCTPSNCFAKAQTDKGALLAPCTHQVVCWQYPRPNGAMACIEGGGIDEHGCPMGIRVNCDTCTRARAKWLAENKGGVPAIQGYPSGTKGGTGASPQCGGCGPLDMGCEIGKQFCEFQSWITKNIGGASSACTCCR